MVLIINILIFFNFKYLKIDIYIIYFQNIVIYIFFFLSKLNINLKKNSCQNKKLLLYNFEIYIDIRYFFRKY